MNERQLVVAALVTLDGIHGSPRSWAGPYFDDDAAARSLTALATCDAMLMGRTTYEYFASSWPNGTGPYADRVNDIRKYVFSTTMTTADWQHTTVVADDPVSAVRDLKRARGGDLMIYGYGRLAQTLFEHDLVDELRFTVFPVMAGDGTPLFRQGRNVPLRLLAAEPRTGGVIELTYTR